MTEENKTADATQNQGGINTFGKILIGAMGFVSVAGVFVIYLVLAGYSIDINITQHAPYSPKVDAEAIKNDQELFFIAEDRFKTDMGHYAVQIRDLVSKNELPAAELKKWNGPYLSDADYKRRSKIFTEPNHESSALEVASSQGHEFFMMFSPDQTNFNDVCKDEHNASFDVKAATRVTAIKVKPVSDDVIDQLIKGPLLEKYGTKGSPLPFCVDRQDNSVYFIKAFAFDKR